MEYIHINTKNNSLKSILKKNVIYQSSYLKIRLIKEKIFESKCYKCNNTEWNNQKIPLELEHINGDRNDQRLENLTLLCPNCHAQTVTYKSKNKYRYKNIKPNKISNNIKISLDEFKTKAKYNSKQDLSDLYKISISSVKKICKKYNIKTQSNTNKRPDLFISKEILENEIQLYSFVELSKKYNISDNALRKRCKRYNIDLSKAKFARKNRK